MSFAAEPFGLFVDDLLTGLTGGVVREGFRFLPEEAPFRLDPPAPLLRETVRVHGIAGGVHMLFRAGPDYVVDADFILAWKATAEFRPLAGAALPDQGSRFWVNYEHRGLVDAAPILTDRNPGSITRLLAESFAREFAVLSGQLEQVYRAGFVETATGRDLDQLALLLGVRRARAGAVTGSVVFSRGTPAPADIPIPAGTRVSTTDAPSVLFETTEPRTLRRGDLSAEAPIQALAPGRGSIGRDSIVPAGAIGALHRPLLGIDRIVNRLPTSLAGDDETDAALRARLRRALAQAGKATTGALIGALSEGLGLREKDIRVAEDPIARPGLIEIDVALPALPGDAPDPRPARALALIDATRPAGVRVLANLATPVSAGGPAPPQAGGIPDEGASPVRVVDGARLFYPVDVTAVLAPEALGLTPADQATMAAAGDAAIHAFIADAGIGEALIYNRLVARLIAIPGVQDVVLEMRPAGQDGPRHRNILPANPGARPAAGSISVRVGALLVLLDVAVRISLRGAGGVGPPDAQRANALREVEARLRAGLAQISPDTGPGASGPGTSGPGTSGTVSTATLRAMLGEPDSFSIDALHFQASFQDAGIRLLQRDPELPVTGLERFWLGGVNLLNEPAA